MKRRLLIPSFGAIIRTGSRCPVLLFGQTKVGSTAVQNYLDRQRSTLCRVLCLGEFCVPAVNAERCLRAVGLQQSNMKGQRDE